MFHMKFQSTMEYSSGEEGNERTVRQSNGDATVQSDPFPKGVVFEGNVGKFLKVRSLPSTDITIPQGFTDGHSSLRSMTLSPTAQVAPELVNLEESTQGSADSLHLQVKNVHALGGTTSLRVNHRIIHKSSTIVVTNLHCQASTRPQDSKMVSVEAPCALVTARKTDDSSRSTELSECSTPSHRNEEEKAMTEIVDKLMQERKNIVHSADKFTKPWAEPLLAAHNQEEPDLMAKEEAKVEANRLFEEQRLERQRQIRELRGLALCNLGPSPSLGESPAFKKSKLTKILGKTGMTSCFGIFGSNKKHSEYPDAQETKVVITKGSLFVPSSGTTSLDSQLAVMRNAQQLRASKQPTLQFTKVISTQRDVPAWTRDEYLRKNGRIPMNRTTNQKEDEFGGIEGNNLMNQYFDDDLTDSDSDSD